MVSEYNDGGRCVSGYEKCINKGEKFETRWNFQ